MSEATIIYPHQLNLESKAISTDRPIYLVEETLILTFNPTHRQKLIFHKLSMDAFEKELKESGHTVRRLEIAAFPKTASVFEYLKKQSVTKVHVADTTDIYLETALANSGLERIWYESPLFALPKSEAVERYEKSGRFMAKFYKQLRVDRNILVDKNEKPVGGKWSFDEDNRKKLPKDIELPEDLQLASNEEVVAATEWVNSLEVELYGEAGCWLPYSRSGAEKFLKEFFRQRFNNFGTYEDAISTEHTRLFHSAISPLLNVGLLTPEKVLTDAIKFAKENDIPMNSLEGFVRQILGWREFIRAAYEADGTKMRTKNFWNHTKALPASFWNGTTSIQPIDQSIERALAFGYTHHIERLMVLGNFMLLMKIDPDDVYQWFMGMYVDAYDWVMVPNVYGMSQFADGGIFATKPYISGSNYIKKMSDYSSGEWEDVWTGLYWNFIASHYDFFSSNHRLSMMPRLYDKMSLDKKQHYQEIVADFLELLNKKS